MSHRILFISHLFPNPAERTKGTFMLNRAAALKAAGCDITVISPVPYVPPLLRRLQRYRGSHFEERQSEIGGVSAHYTRYFRPPGSFFKAYEGRSMFASVKRLAAQLDREKPFDVILGGMLTNDGVAVIKLGKKLGVPAYCHAIGSDIHTYPLESPRIRNLTAAVLADLDGIISVGENFTGIINREFPGFEEKTFCSPQGIDTARFAPGNSGALHADLGLEHDIKIGLFVGRLSKDKGIGDLIAAIPQIQSKKIFFVLVGTGPLSNRLEELIQTDPRFRNCKIYPELAYPGVGADELARCYQNADFFVFPSHKEGSPTVMVEAASCGLPIVASDIPPNHDILTEGANGHFFKMGDPADLAAKVEAIVESDQIEKFSDRSRMVASEGYDRDENAARLVEHLFPRGNSSLLP